MRKNIVAGNWKMNLTLQEGIALAKDVNSRVSAISPKCEIVLGTPFTHITEVVKTVDAPKISVAAQNCANKVPVPIPAKFLLLWLNQPVHSMSFWATPSVVP